MKNEHLIYKSFLALALFFQGLIDCGGYLGWYYNQYPTEVFSYVGYAPILPFDISFAIYLLWMVIYYLSIVLMFISNKAAKTFIIISLTLSFFSSFIGGIWVATPHELLLSWVGWASYIVACTMFFTSNKLNYANKKT